MAAMPTNSLRRSRHRGAGRVWMLTGTLAAALVLFVLLPAQPGPAVDTGAADAAAVLAEAGEGSATSRGAPERGLRGAEVVPGAPLPRHRFVFLIGTEGSGHHAMWALGHHAARHDSDIHFERFNAFEWNQVRVRDVRTGLDRARAQHKKLLYYGGQSYPYGNIREVGVDRGIEIDRLWEFMTARGLETRGIVMYRDPVRAAMAHYEWDGTIEGHCKSVEYFQDVIHEMIGRIPKDTWRLLEYEKLTNTLDPTHARLLDALADWIGVRRDHMAGAGAEVLKPTDPKKKPKALSDKAEAYFAGKNLRQRWFRLFEESQSMLKEE